MWERGAQVVSVEAGRPPSALESCVPAWQQEAVELPAGASSSGSPGDITGWVGSFPSAGGRGI